MPQRNGPGSAASILGLIISLGLVAAVSAAGAAFNAEALRTWYPALAKSGLNPPNIVFPIVWTALYAMMAFAAWRIWRAAGFAGAPIALLLYAVQLALNLLWSYLFFKLARPDLAFLEIGLLALFIMAAILAFWRHDRLAAFLLVPYLAWVAFAGFLNLEILRLNP